MATVSRSLRLEQRGLKRSLGEPGKPEQNYTVFAYVPELCDKLLQNPKHKKRLPDVQCNECLAMFRQKSITDYNTSDEFDDKYLDLQFHKFGGVCLWCRAPSPAEGYFEKHDLHPLRKLLPFVLGGVSALEVIVWEYYRSKELPAHTRLDPIHVSLMKSEDINHVFQFGLQHMTVPGVELVYNRRVGQTQFGPNSAPDIKLDYRYWRPEHCKCTKVPCECICYRAQIRNITKKLVYANPDDYNVLGILLGTTWVMQNHDFNKDKYQTFFVYLRDWSPLNPDTVHVVDNGSDFPAGVCRMLPTTSRNGHHRVITDHSDECQRRNAPYSLYKCMMNESLCRRCADCKRN
jgi:hypothetical protein